MCAGGKFKISFRSARRRRSWSTGFSRNPGETTAERRDSSGTFQACAVKLSRLIVADTLRSASAECSTECARHIYSFADSSDRRLA